MQIEEEAAALLAEAGLVIETAPVEKKKPRARKAAAEAETAVPAPRKSRTRDIPLETIARTEEPSDPPARKPRKKVA